MAMDDQTQQLDKTLNDLTNKVVDTNKNYYLHLFVGVGILAVSIYVGAFIAGKGWKAAGA